MLRLIQVKEPRAIKIDGDEDEPQALRLTFAGDAGPHAYCEITLHMTDRGDDEKQFRDARAILRDAVATLHAEFQSEARPAAPSTS